MGKYHVFSFKVQFIKNHFFCPVRVGGGWGAIPQTRVYLIEKGSSEMMVDLMFMIIWNSRWFLTAVTQTAVAPTVVIL